MQLKKKGLRGQRSREIEGGLWLWRTEGWRAFYREDKRSGVVCRRLEDIPYNERDDDNISVSGRSVRDCGMYLHGGTYQDEMRASREHGKGAPGAGHNAVEW